MLELKCEPNDLTFKLTTSGFTDEEDGWLELKVEVTQGENSFSETGSWLEAKDIRSIADWFVALSMNRLPSSARLCFQKPNMSFNFLDSSYSGVVITIKLESEDEHDFMPRQFHPDYFENGNTTFETLLEYGGYDPYGYKNELIFEIAHDAFTEILASLTEAGLKYSSDRNDDAAQITE